MGWLWIIFGVLLMMGSLSWLMPSPRERREARQRQAAQALGLRVRIHRLDAWAQQRLERQALMEYGIPMEHAPDDFVLWRVPDRPEPWTAPPDSGGWRWLQTPVVDALNQLPVEISGVGVSHRYLWLAFDDGAVELNPADLSEWLSALSLSLTSQSPGLKQAAHKTLR